MITRIQTGTSFKGAGLYYLHDKRLEGEKERHSAGRVAWTHAVNTLEEEPEAVLAEMQHTALNQALLKQLSGGRGDGRPTGKTVMTVALAWSPEEKPTRQDMIEAGQSFLQHMGWQDHQVLFVGHNDTKHPHVHLILNRVHPETGLTMDDAWSKTRAQHWALAYEQEHGRVFCEAREAKYGRDQDISARHMNYREWQEVAKESALDPEYRRALEAGEWDVLRQAQKQKRIGFWKDTSAMRKDLRIAIREEVREEFAEDWHTYAIVKAERIEHASVYDKEARRAIRQRRDDPHVVAQIKEWQGDYHSRLREDLKEIRLDISSRQKERIEELAGPALQHLSQERSAEYKELLAGQKAEREALKKDQEEGTRRRDLLETYTVTRREQPQFTREREREYVDHARQVTTRRTDRLGPQARSEENESPGHPVHSWERPSAFADSRAGRDPRRKAPRKDAADLLAGSGLALIGRIADSLETLFDGSEPTPTHEQESHAMSQDKAPRPHPSNEQQQKQNDADQEARRQAAVDEMLAQRARERGSGRDR